MRLSRLLKPTSRSEPILRVISDTLSDPESIKGSPVSSRPELDFTTPVTETSVSNPPYSRPVHDKLFSINDASILLSQTNLIKSTRRFAYDKIPVLPLESPIFHLKVNMARGKNPKVSLNAENIIRTICQSSGYFTSFVENNNIITVEFESEYSTRQAFVRLLRENFTVVLPSNQDKQTTLLPGSMVCIESSTTMSLKQLKKLLMTECGRYHDMIVKPNKIYVDFTRIVSASKAVRLLNEYPNTKAFQVLNSNQSPSS